MTIAPIEADTPIADAPTTQIALKTNADLFLQFLGMTDTALQHAVSSERAVAQGHGTILAMSVERARADALLQVAAAGLSHVVNGVTFFTNMSV